MASCRILSPRLAVVSWPIAPRWLLLCVAIAGCEGTDLGKPCTALLDGIPPSSGTVRTETLTTVGQSTCFPCRELLCVAADGTEGYCSKKCRGDEGCPTGFECRVLHTVGAFANEGFCVWRRCSSADDCDGGAQMECKEMTATDPRDNIHICAYTADGDPFGEVEEVTCDEEANQ